MIRPATLESKRLLFRDLIAASSSLIGYPIIFVYFTIFANLMDANSFGILQLSLAVAVLAATLSTLGSEFATAHFLASRAADGRRTVLIAGATVSVVQASLFGVLLAFTAPALVNQVFNISDEDVSIAINVLRWMAVYSVFIAIGYWMRSAFQGLRRFHYRSLLFISLHFGVFLSAMAILLFTDQSVNVMTVAVIFAGSTAIPVLFWAGTIWRVAGSGPVSMGAVLRQGRQLISYGGRVFFAKMGWETYRWADVLLVGVFLSPKYVGAYAIATLVATSGIRGSTYMLEVLFPVISKEHGSGRNRSVSFAIEQGFRLNAYLLLPFTGFLIIASPLIVFTLYGESFEGAILPMRLLAIMSLSHVFAIAGPALMGIDRPQALSKVTTMSAAANVLLNLMLIPLFGVAGAAGASVITRWGNWIYGMHQLKQFIRFTLPAQLVLRAFLAMAIATAISYWILNMVWSPQEFETISGLFGVALLIGTGLFFYTLYAALAILLGCVTRYDLKLLEAVSGKRLKILERLAVREGLEG